jgi:starch phosphorylase
MGGGGAPATELDAWSRRLVAHWGSLRFGRLETQEDQAGRRLSLEVYLDDLSLEDVTVQLYADPIADQPTPIQVVMQPTRALPGTAHGHVFSASVPAGRPLSDYTPRIVPSAARVAIPLELPLVTWQR